MPPTSTSAKNGINRLENITTDSNLAMACTEGFLFISSSYAFAFNLRILASVCMSAMMPADAMASLSFTMNTFFPAVLSV